MTATPDITFGQVYQRIISQLPPWFGNQQFVPPPPLGEKTPTTNFNNVMWAFLMTAFTSYTQFQYDFLNLRIGQYEINNEKNQTEDTPDDFPFYNIPISPFIVFDLIYPEFLSAKIINGGLNYREFDLITFSGGSFQYPAVLEVTEVDSNGAILNYDIFNGGQYATPPTNPVGISSTDGVGSGALFNVLWKLYFPTYPIAFSDNLDLISQDFFGGLLPRRATEADDMFRYRILSTVLKPKCTRPAMITALTNLVLPAFVQAGIPLVPPEIYEPWDSFDNGGYNVYQALAFGTPGGFNGVGAYGNGDSSSAYTCLIVVYLPSGSGLADYPGYVSPTESVTWGAGFGDSSITPSTPAIDIPPQWYGDGGLLNYYVTESDIIALINLVKVLGTTYTLQIIYVN